MSTESLTLPRLLATAADLLPSRRVGRISDRKTPALKNVTRIIEHRAVATFDRWLTRDQSRLRQVSFCLAVCLGVLSIRYVMEDWIHGGLPFVLLTPMVTICSLRMGWAGGLLSIASGLLYFQVVTPHVPGRSGGFLVAEGLFVASSLLNVFVCDRCRIALREITRQRALEQARTQAQVDLALRSTSLGGLTASVRHEVNQPLAAAKTFAQAGLRWLSRSPPNIEECRAALLRVVEAADQADSLLKRLGTAIGPTAPDRAPACLVGIINEAVALISPQAEAQGIAIVLALDACSCTLLADRVMLQQVFSNLLSNGVEACAERRDGPRSIEVACRREREAVLVAIDDTGVGFAEEDPERSFAAFYTTKATGMGLGLPISRKTVEAHGGALTVGNREDGRGAFALVRLPLTA